MRGSPRTQWCWYRFRHLSSIGVGRRVTLSTITTCNWTQWSIRTGASSWVTLPIKPIRNVTGPIKYIRSGAGGGFFLVCEDLGRMFDSSFPACTFFALFFFFFKAEINLRKLIPHSRPGSANSSSASWDDCDWVFPDELCVSSFPDRFPHYTCSIVSPLQLRCVKVVCMFRCNLPPAFLAKWLGSFTCHCGNTGWNGHQIRVSTESYLLRRKFSCSTCQDLNVQPYDQESGILPMSSRDSLM